MDGIRRLVSVGYLIHQKETDSKSGGVEVVRVTDWEPYEISLVSIPADNSVGVGRSGNDPTQSSKNINTMSENNTTPTAPPADASSATRSAEVIATPDA